MTLQKVILLSLAWSKFLTPPIFQEPPPKMVNIVSSWRARHFHHFKLLNKMWRQQTLAQWFTFVGGKIWNWSNLSRERANINNNSCYRWHTEKRVKLTQYQRLRLHHIQCTVLYYFFQEPQNRVVSWSARLAGSRLCLVARIVFSFFFFLLFFCGSC